MSSLFERLQKLLELEKKEEGITALDLATLPPALRKIMRMMLREVQMYHVDLVNAIEEWPEKDRLSSRDLNNSLKTLTEQGWLICRGEGDKVNYQVNLRRKAGSKIAAGLWLNLQNRLGGGAPPPAEPDAEQPPEDKTL